ncbi:UNVERIFIED_CONTAM: hypothetical protein K2H54_070470 [Gekko kuhli]
MQEAAAASAESASSAPGGSSSSSSSSFSSHAAPASIKEEEASPEKERPPEAEYLNARCVLFTYFQGDISAVVDEHFSRALSQPSSYSPGSGAKAARSSASWRAAVTAKLRIPAVRKQTMCKNHPPRPIAGFVL